MPGIILRSTDRAGDLFYNGVLFSAGHDGLFVIGMKIMVTNIFYLQMLYISEFSRFIYDMRRPLLGGV